MRRPPNIRRGLLLKLLQLHMESDLHVKGIGRSTEKAPPSLLTLTVGGVFGSLVARFPMVLLLLLLLRMI
jgi:hypothetical protein